MRKFIMLLFVFVGASLLAACSLGSSQPDPCNDGGSALFHDDFGGEQECGWAVYNQGGAVAAIEEGAFRISSSQPGQIWWSNPGRNFDDVVIIAQARQLGGPDDNAYGVICRYQNEENFYLFLISGDGFYAIGKYQSGTEQVTYLTQDGRFQPSDVINQGMATNQIRASCIGSELTLAVNGLPLVTVTDPTFVTGDVGMGVSTLQPGTAVVEFDDFLAIAP